MKNIFLLFILIALYALIGSAQGINIGSGSTFSLGGGIFSLPGDWTNAGTFTAGSGTVIFNGPSGNQTVNNVYGEIFQNLTVNKTSGDMVLETDIDINGMLTIISGDIDLNRYTIAMGASALLSETAGNIVKGNGMITGTLDLNGPNAVNPFGLGATISSKANLGPTSITRGHQKQEVGKDSSILRYYDIDPKSNLDIDATLVFHYDGSELNGLLDSTLCLYRSTDDGATWEKMGGEVDTTAKTVTLTGISELSRWTLAGKNGATDVDELGGETSKNILAPRILSLANYPNPFNPATTIEFTVPKDGKAVVKIFNMLGQEIMTAFAGDAKAGQYYRVKFEGSRFSSGMYICTIETAARRMVRKMLMLK